MTYEESAQLMTDITLRNRIKVAALKYSDAILNRPLTTEAINTQRSWARTTAQGPDQAAMQLQPAVVMDSAVQTAGAEVTDEALQGAVETVVNRSF